MDFKNTKVYNFEGAFHGMRNPMNSWDKSDSYFGITDICDGNVLNDIAEKWDETQIKFDNYEWLEKNGVLRGSDNYDGLYEVALIGPK